MDEHSIEVFPSSWFTTDYSTKLNNQFSVTIMYRVSIHECDQIRSDLSKSMIHKSRSLRDCYRFFFEKVVFIILSKTNLISKTRTEHPPPPLKIEKMNLFIKNRSDFRIKVSLCWAQLFVNVEISSWSIRCSRICVTFMLSSP